MFLNFCGLGNILNLTFSKFLWFGQQSKFNFEYSFMISLNYLINTQFFNCFHNYFIKYFLFQRLEKLGPRIIKCRPILKLKRGGGWKENYLRGKINKNCVWIGDENNEYPLAVGIFELCNSISKLNVRLWMRIIFSFIPLRFGIPSLE